MLDGLFMLLLLSFIMAIAYALDLFWKTVAANGTRSSFLAGSLPLSFALSQSRLRLVATIGMGVLVGTALIVIIPEGVETLYSASDYSADSHARRSIGSANVDVNLNALHRLLPRAEEHASNWRMMSRDLEDPTNPLKAAPGPVLPAGTSLEADTVSDAPPKTPTGAGEIGILGDEHHPKLPLSEPSKDKTVKPDSPPTQREPHAWIGLSLVFGFILMYLLDTLPFLAPPSASNHQNNIYSLSDLSTSPAPPSGASPQRSLSTTLGLCIHSAADGIALGASSASTSTASLSLIIFVAIMVHKAPAAFGLTSVLLKQGLSKRAARAHLVIFSLAAPAGALCTWILVRALGGGGQGEPALMKWWTGVLLLFSGGTFL